MVMVVVMLSGDPACLQVIAVTRMFGGDGVPGDPKI